MSASGAGRVAFVSGAARGIGHATATLLLRKGWTVGAFDIDGAHAGLAGLDKVAAQHGSQAITGRLDVRDPQQWHDALAQVAGERLDLLVNNAGTLVSGPFHQTPIERHRTVVEVNVIGAINGAHAAFGHLQRTPGSKLVNLCSASAIYGQPDLATYAATKFALRGFTEALELEWAEYDIRVLDLWPLYVNTDMVTGMDTASVRSMGVRLTEHDVAAGLVAAVDRVAARPASSWRPPKVHHHIGRQARVLGLASQLSPHWGNRLLTKRIAKR